MGPVFRQAWSQAQFIAFAVDAQQGFNQQPIHPPGGTGIPRPTAPASVWRNGIDVGGGDVRLDFVGCNLLGSAAVMDGIEQREQFPRAVVVTHDRKSHGSPDRPVSILASIFSHARNVTFDVTRIER